MAKLLDDVSAAVEVTMVTRDRDLGCDQPYSGLSGQWVRRRQARIYYLDAKNRRQLYRILRTLRSTMFDLLYVNSLWATFAVVPIVATRIGLLRVREILIAPRGELSPSALKVKSFKKRLFLRVWRPLIKSSRVRWHATSDREAQSIAQVFPRARIETRQVDVALPLEPMAPVELDGPLRLVFIGRINPIKNLSLTILALARITRPVIFDLYGPVEDPAYWAECQDLARQLPPAVTLAYGGELRPGDVPSTFAGYDAFVFPTQGENFGHVIAESLSASCPVICSDQTPWSSLLRAGGGIVLADLTPAALAEQLDQLARRTPTERLAARRAAGDAYRSWRAEARGPNILDQIRLLG
ncbi:glycosyltransferase [Verrucosispora sioxanthis]|uniref:Glycosyltransferase n=1 Tax=Verrucosispora sioxanthis TaxID=2499994 RepID=A0A6M1L6T5_9ACTN|nr:glycosyltransferase [Verrucosispora sioxanthis]NEE62303.1 glycosyltransferase [Verrucosispora sioxanthis]NGM11413.1 glycosyltransferase [Verrucosispora sioxanthis]